MEAGRNAAKKKNWREASKHFDDCIALKPDIFIDAMEAKYEMLVDQQKDEAGAKAWASEVMAKLGSSPVGLAEFAVFMAQDPRLDKHDLETAQAMIDGAMTAGGTKTDVLVAAARVAAASGKFDTAVDLQGKAWRQASPEQKPYLKTDLDAYKQSQAKGASAKVGQ
jgi:lipopolysaccharide biosynthesis regulator YciM